MRLTSFTDYTLRVLMYLALHQQRLATIQGIAQAYSISENHLMKVVHHLAKTGVIESVRGKGGGIRLASPPEKILLGAVVRAAEGDSPIAECFGEGNTCCITASCQLIPILAHAFDALYAVLDQHTLADLVNKPMPMARLLKIDLVR